MHSYTHTHMLWHLCALGGGQSQSQSKSQSQSRSQHEGQGQGQQLEASGRAGGAITQTVSN